MAVYVLISLIPALPYVLVLIQTVAETHNIWHSLATLSIAFLFPIIWLAFGFLLLKFSSRIATKLVPEDEGVEIIPVGSADTVQKIIFVSIGLLITVHALPQIAEAVISIAYTPRSDLQRMQTGISRLPAGILLGFITKAVLGLLLMVRPGKVLGLIKRYQKESRP